MASRKSPYTTKELSRKTWPDFVSLTEEWLGFLLVHALSAASVVA
jgi:hypothetical protein